jgi:anti-sigma factor RsiW
VTKKTMSRPDEGLIHAWLDGELDAAEAARVATLVETDAEWAAAVAEARGLIAASARIVSALDNVPKNVLPQPSTPNRQPSTITRRRHWALSPRFLATAGLAATILILVNVVPPRTGEVTDGIAVKAPEDVASKIGTAPTPRTTAVEADRPAAKIATAAKSAKENEVSFRDERARQVPAARAAAASQLSQQLSAPQVTQQQLQRQSQAASAAGVPAPVGAAAAEGQRKDLVASDVKLDSLQKKMEEAAKNLSPVVATATGESRRFDVAGASRATVLSRDDSARQQCFREAQPPLGIESIQRVLRINDTTASPLTVRAEAAAKAASPISGGAGAMASNALTNTRSAPARSLTAILRVKGDTLFLPNPDGSFSRSVRVSCPRP